MCFLLVIAGTATSHLAVAFPATVMATPEFYAAPVAYFVPAADNLISSDGILPAADNLSSSDGISPAHAAGILQSI